MHIKFKKNYFTIKMPDLADKKQLAAVIVEKANTKSTSETL